MLDETIKDKLRSIYQAMDKVSLPEKGDGWVSMFDFQREVWKSRINFKNLGYEWFNEFLNDSELFFIWTDFSGEKPTRYVIEKLNQNLTKSKEDHNTIVQQPNT